MNALPPTVDCQAKLVASGLMVELGARWRHRALLAAALLAPTLDLASAAEPDSRTLHSTLDGGGGRSASAAYVADTSLGGFGGFGQTAAAANTLRQGYTGQLNEPPAARADTLLCPHGRSLRLDEVFLLANDTDAEGDPFTIVAVAPAGAADSLLAYEAPWVAYTPSASGSNTVDTFTYTVSDGYGATAVGRVQVTFTAAVAEPPAGGARLELGEVRPDGSHPLRLLLARPPAIVLEMSTNLADWLPLGTNAPLAETVDSLDSETTASSGFYRTRTTGAAGAGLRLTLEDHGSNGVARLRLDTSGARQTILERSSDMLHWTPLLTNSFAARTLSFTDDRLTNAPSKFYRAFARP